MSGYLVSVESFEFTSALVKIAFSMLFLTISANVFSEFSSVKIYSLIKHFYPRSWRKNANHSVIASAILFGAGFAVARGISFYVSELYSLIAVLLWAYLHKLKNVRFIRSVFISSAASVAVLLGSSAGGSSDAANMMALLLFFSNMAGDMVKSVTEGMKDRTTFLVNLIKRFSSYMKFDEGRTIKSAAFMLAVFIILSPLPYVSGVMPLAYLAVVTISSLIAFSALFSLVKDGKNMASLAKADELIKINMLVAIIAFLAGVLM